MKLPEQRIKKIIVLEDWDNYLEFLKVRRLSVSGVGILVDSKPCWQPLEELDPRVQVVPLSGHQWDTYTTLKESALKDVPSLPWEAGRM